jgi:type 1 glutamine amidotransferase
MRLPRGLIALAAAIVAAASASADDKPKRLLLVTHSGGFIHDSVGVAEDVLKEVGPKNGIEVTCYRFTGDPTATVKYRPKKDAPEVQANALEKYSADFRARTGKTVGPENCGRVNKETLKNFDGVLFFTTGNPMTKEEVKDLVDWVNAGGAFCGTHCATDTLYQDDAYGNLIGAYFTGHPPGLQKIKVRVEDPKHPAAAGFADGQGYEDEMYVFRAKPYSRDRLRVILSIGKGSFNPGGKLTRPDDDYAISWVREEGKGKVFYTSFGHARKVWQDADGFQKHLIGGLKWAMGQLPGDATPSGKK